MKRAMIWAPFALFFLFAGLAAYQLTQPKDETIRSAMVGKALPEFDLPGQTEGAPRLTQAYFTDGKPRLLNIWASWCLPCIAEAPQLEALEREGAEIVGIAIRDTPDDIATFLARHGDPYSRIARDDISEVQLGIGSSGVPETFVVDGNGIIRHQHIGDIRADDVPFLLEKLEEAQ
ncbi:DsbE family thiol:disulfide interchange protein [Parerythrobacter jejuensis]|uniref:DsbE family thiol:disulfide interchange protein n=1 Tax=Parerythrobacter jejuensis TaxID=795812 RepID=A0A845ARP3_9SPHN|nr:DsbE family thiol:disulfide interchange protein [Parerythrobacter jejuensis]MXP32057.1 DsbE family thiol:disulfide interchange protein [Parerythrobacter jejuensis]